jgi:hypothetical protein
VRRGHDGLDVQEPVVDAVQPLVRDREPDRLAAVAGEEQPVPMVVRRLEQIGPALGPGRRGVVGVELGVERLEQRGERGEVL